MRSFNLEFKESKEEHLLNFLEFMNAYDSKTFNERFERIVDDSLECEYPVADHVFLGHLFGKLTDLNTSTLMTPLIYRAMSYVVSHRNPRKAWSSMEFHQIVMRKWLNSNIVPDHDGAIKAIKFMVDKIPEFDINYGNASYASLSRQLVFNRLRFEDTHLKQLHAMGAEIASNLFLLTVHDEFVVEKLKVMLDAGADPFKPLLHTENNESFYQKMQVLSGKAGVPNAHADVMDILNAMWSAKCANEAANSSAPEHITTRKRLAL